MIAIMTPPKKREPKTAAALMAELEADPDYRARRARLDTEHRQGVAASWRALAPLHRDLAKASHPLDYVDELRTGGKRLDVAVPVLLKWLPRLKGPADQEVVVRVLSFRWVGDEVMRAFLALFRATPNGEFSLKWAIGNGIEVLASERYLSEMAALARDRTHGRAREMIVLGLGKVRTPESEALLIELLSDEDICGHAVCALGILRAGSAISSVIPRNGFARRRRRRSRRSDRSRQPAPTLRSPIYPPVRITISRSVPDSGSQTSPGRPRIWRTSALSALPG